MANFYLDEGIAESLVARLTSAERDVLSTRDAGNKGQSDPRQLAFARQTGRVTITSDGRHFAALHETLVLWAGFWGIARSLVHPGILIVPNGNEIAVDQLVQIVTEVIARYPDLRGRCFAWSARTGWLELFAEEGTTTA
jgi:hypothetical protein